MIDQKTILKIKPGSTVAVQDKFGTFQGIVIAKKHGNEIGSSFTVRGIVGGVGVEKVFPVHSPAILKVRIVSAPKKIQRSKLYWIRNLSKKKISQKIGTAV